MATGISKRLFNTLGKGEELAGAFEKGEGRVDSKEDGATYDGARLRFALYTSA